MANIILRDGLIYTDVMLTYKNKSVVINNALIDTGSSSTVISIDTALEIGLKPEPTDIINSVQGIGGSESVIEKVVDSIRLDNASVKDFHIQIGAMDYGIELEAIIGLDLLTRCGATIDLDKFILVSIYK